MTLYYIMSVSGLHRRLQMVCFVQPRYIQHIYKTDESSKFMKEIDVERPVKYDAFNYFNYNFEK